MSIKEEIQRLKEEKDVVILAHYYVDGAVQEVADYVGDSYALAKLATTVEKNNIIFCGVSFMGESAKILNENKNVYMVDYEADCPMAHMVELDKIDLVRSQYEDVAVVCYVNSTAAIKTKSDVCVTSSNAVRIVEKLPNKNIFFIPDNNLARYVSKQVPDKHFIFNDGFCPIHKEIKREDVIKAKEAHPGVKLLTHPECTEDVLELSDFIGSTSEIIDYATANPAEEYLIGTETGVFYELQKKNPDTKFYAVKENQICPDMKKITMDKLLATLKEIGKNQDMQQVVMDKEVSEKAGNSLKRMLELAR